jgi:hypothetical protein
MLTGCGKLVGHNNCASAFWGNVSCTTDGLPSAHLGTTTQKITALRIKTTFTIVISCSKVAGCYVVFYNNGVSGVRNLHRHIMHISRQ